jgi:hypothetical protein
MRRVDAAALGHHLGQRLDFRRLRMHRRRIDQPRAQPRTAFFQRLFQQFGHPCDFVRRRRARFDAHHGRADRPVPDQHRRIHRRLLRGQQRAIFRYRLPWAGISVYPPI